jgi:sugar lactone lactonase YvrE
MKWEEGAMQGTVVAGFGGSGSQEFQLSTPKGLRVSSSGDVVVADYGNSRISKWAPGSMTGTIVAGWNAGSYDFELYHPYDVNITDDGVNLTVVDYYNHRIMEYKRKALPSAQAVLGLEPVIFAGGTGSAGLGSLSSPQGLYVETGTTYVADTNAHRVVAIAPGGRDVRIVAGGAGNGYALSQLSYPSGIAVVDGAIIFVSDSYNHRVVRWSPGSAEGTVVGGFRGAGSGLAQLHYPKMLLVTGEDNDVLVCDYNNHRILKYSESGKLPITANVLFGGSSGSDLYSFSTPSAVFQVPNGDVYVADENNHRILAFSSVGAYPRVVAGGNGAGHSLHQLYSPSDVAVDSLGRIYVSDYHSHRIVRWPAENSPEREVAEGEVLEGVVVAGKDRHAGHGLTHLYYPRGIYLSETSAGVVDVYVADNYNSRVVKWTAGATEGEVVAGGNGRGSRLDQLNYPHGVTVGADGTVYVSDRSNSRVMAWAPGSTEGSVVAGRYDGSTRPGNAMDQLNHPWGLHLDSDGTLFIADQSNHRVVAWAPEATEGVTVAGLGNPGSGSEAYRLYSPKGVHVAEGVLSVADSSNQRIVQWMESTSAIQQGAFERRDISVFAGGQGAGSAAWQLYHPFGIAEYDKKFYITDVSNHRVVRWGPGDTAGTTVAGFNGAGNTFSQFNSPKALTVVDDGIFVVDGGNHRVMRWLPGATAGFLYAGYGGSGAAQHQLNNPVGLHVDSEAIYVSEAGNHRVVKWSLVSDPSTCILGAPSGPGVLHDCSGSTFNETCSAFCSGEWSGGTTEFKCEAGGIFYGREPECNAPTPAPTPAPTIHLLAGTNACGLPSAVDPENLCVVDQSGYATVDHDSQADPQLSLTISAKDKEHEDTFKTVHGPTVGSIIDERLSNSRYVIGCPQAEGEKTVMFTVKRPKEISSFGAEWLMLFPKDSWRNITCEFEPWTYNAFGSKIPLFRAVSNQLADDAPVEDEMHVYMEVSRRGDFEVKYGNPNLEFEGQWLASEFRSSLLRVGSPWSDCGDGYSASDSTGTVGAIMPAYYGHPSLDGGPAKYAQLVAALTGIPADVPVKVILQVFHKDKKDWTTSAAAQYSMCYKVGNACPLSHRVCKPEYCEIDRFAKIIADLKAASPAVSVLASVDEETKLTEYTDAGLDVDGAYFSDPASVTRSLKQAKTAPFSVIALGTPLFDFEAVDKADVFVTFAGDAFSIGAWTPYSWFPEQNATKFAAMVSGALASEVSSTVSAFLDRGYGYVFVTSAEDFSTPPAAGLGGVLETLADSGRRLQVLPPEGRDSYRWGCDDTFLECAPVCYKTRGKVTTRVANARCGDLTMDECSCKCYFEAEWQCVGSDVVCSVRESGSLARRTVGDGVCTSRGTERPTFEELTKTGVCKPLPTERGSAPPQQCTSEEATTRPVALVFQPQVDESTAFRLAIAAIMAVFA